MLLLITGAAGDFEAVLTEVLRGWEVLSCSQTEELKEVGVVQRDTKALCLGAAQTHPCGTTAVGWDLGQGPFAGPGGEEYLLLWGKFAVSTFLKLCTDSDLRLF